MLRRKLVLGMCFLIVIALIACDGKSEKDEMEVSSDEKSSITEEKSPITIDEKKELMKEPRLYEVDGKIYGPLSSNFTLEYKDGGSGIQSVEVSVDKSDFKVYKNPVTFTEEGSHSIRYRAVDNVGNNTIIESYTLTIDNSSPKTTYKIEPKPVIDGNEWFVLPDSKIILSISDNLSGVQKTLFKVDSGSYKSYSNPIGMPGTGGHTFSFKSLDNVGNWEKETTISVIVDAERPETELKPSGPLYDKEGEKWAPVTHKYYLSATDDISGVAYIKYSIDGGKTISYSEPIELDPGRHKIVYYSIDRSNKEEEHKAFIVNVDSVSPEINLIAEAE